MCRLYIHSDAVAQCSMYSPPKNRVESLTHWIGKVASMVGSVGTFCNHPSEAILVNQNYVCLSFYGLVIAWCLHFTSFHSAFLKPISRNSQFVESMDNTPTNRTFPRSSWVKMGLNPRSNKLSTFPRREFNMTSSQSCWKSIGPKVLNVEYCWILQGLLGCHKRFSKIIPQGVHSSWKCCLWL